MNSVKKFATTILSVFLWAVIAVAALFTFTTMATKDVNNVSSIAGYTPMSVQSDSMAPTFRTGDLIIIKKCDPATLAVGDVVCFHTIIENQYALNTHRIAEITDEGGFRSYTTRGDNNLISDQSRIVDGDIVGKYVGKLGGAGRLIDFLSSSTGFLLVIVLPLLAFFIYQVYHLIMISISLKKAALAESRQEAEAGDAAKLADAERMKAEAEAALLEAKRLKAEAEAQLADAANKKD